MGFKKSHIYKVLAKKSKFESIITHWTGIINKYLEIYKIEVEKDISEEKLQKMDIFCDKCFKNNPVSQKSSPSLAQNVMHIIWSYLT